MLTQISEYRAVLRRFRGVVRSYETLDDDIIVDLMDIYDDMHRILKSAEDIQRELTRQRVR